MPIFKKPKTIPNQKTGSWKKNMSFFTSKRAPQRVFSQFLCRQKLWQQFENTLFWPFLAQNGQIKVPSKDQITPPNSFSYQKNIGEDSQLPKYIGKFFFGRIWFDPERPDLLRARRRQEKTLVSHDRLDEHTSIASLNKSYC